MDSNLAVNPLSDLDHDTRLACYRPHLERGPHRLSGGVIAERFNVRPSLLSFHLQYLNQAGLVTRRSGVR